MMGWNNYGGMMNAGWGVFGFFGSLFSIIIFVDALLLGIWLWQQIQKGKK